MTHLSKAAARVIGSFDKASRFTLKPEFETETSRAIRTPSRSFPFSVYKHIFTGKYYKSLNAEQREALKDFVES